MTKVIILLIIIIMINSCTSININTKFSNLVVGSGVVTITGWAKVRGEIMIYPTRNAMEKKMNYPNCISGVFSDQKNLDLSKYDGKLISVVGNLFKFDSLSDEKDSFVLPRKLLLDSIVPNFCFGNNVILINSIKIK